MSSRVTGAGLALIAVALLAVSLATPVVLPAQLSLFAGHPTVANHTRETQDVYVGLYAAQLCNSGGDGTCKSGDASAGFRVFGYAEIALTGGAVLGSLMLAGLTLGRSERRKTAARLVWVAGGLATACAVALILVGPFQGASAPIGIGMALHGAGLLGAMLAGAIAIRPPPPIRLRIAERGAQPRGAQPRSSLPTAQAFDRRASRDDGPPRPGDPGPEPRGGHDRAMRSPSPDARPPADPFAPRHAASERPPFSPAPQLRPLYEATPLQGGTGGLVHVDRHAIPAAIPASPPAPLARGAAHAIPAGPAFADDEPHAAVAPFAGDESRPMPPLVPADEPRPAAPRLPADEPRPAAPRLIADEPRPPMPRLPADEPRPANEPRPSHEPRPAAPRATADEPRTTAPRFAVGEPRPQPPPAPTARPKPPTAPPPLPASLGIAVPPALSPPGPAGHKPRTQVSFVPPMPDNDLPIAPPTAQIAAEPGESPSTAAPALVPRGEPPPAAAPLAIPPPPGSSSRARRDSQLPAPLRGIELPRPGMRAAVPLPARPGASGPSAGQPPPSTLRGVPLRPAIGAPVPPIPAIPAIPPIPPPRRADTDVTDPQGQADASADADADAATVARVPIEVADYISQTHVSVGMPSPEEVDAAVDGAAVLELDDAAPRHGDGAAYALDDRGQPALHAAADGQGGPAESPRDTSPSGEPVAAGHAGDATVTGEPLDAAASAAAVAASRPTIQAPAQRPADVPTIIGPPIPRTFTPQRHDRAMPKLPISTAPASLPPPRDNKQAAGPSPACPQCEAPMAWVEEHLRFYCKSCRMYF